MRDCLEYVNMSVNRKCVTPDIPVVSPTVTPATALLSVQFVCCCTIHEPGKGLEIERTHKRPGSFVRRSAECHLFKFRKNLKYLAAAQWNTPQAGGKLPCPR